LDKQNFENYEKIYLFLDNDEAGEKAKKQLIAKFEGRIKDKSKIYAGYKDVNEFLVQEK
jgi:DNA primase